MINLYDIDKFVNPIFGKSKDYTLTTQTGSPIVSFKTLLKAECKSGGSVVFEPIEQNSFSTYNKTTEPREFYFEVALQYPYQDFGVILGELENLKVGTDLFIFVTPWNSYSNLTLEGYTNTFEHTTSMLIVGLQCKEVKEVQQGYTNVVIESGDTSPSGSSPIGSDDAKNPDNTTTTDTGMTGARKPTTEEQQRTNESIIVIANGGDVIVPGSGDTGGDF